MMQGESLIGGYLTEDSDDEETYVKAIIYLILTQSYERLSDAENSKIILTNVYQSLKNMKRKVRFILKAKSLNLRITDKFQVFRPYLLLIIFLLQSAYDLMDDSVAPPKQMNLKYLNPFKRICR